MTSGNGVPAASDRDEGTQSATTASFATSKTSSPSSSSSTGSSPGPIRKLRTVRTEGTITPAGSVIPEQPGSQDGADTPASRRLAGARGRNRVPASCPSAAS